MTPVRALVVVLSLLAAACNGSDDTEGGSRSGVEGTTTAIEKTLAKGGTAVFGAELEPKCVDWIAICAGDPWGTYMMAANTMPRPFDFDSATSSLKASILLAGEPKLDPGPPQTVTYKLNPKAVWSDGTAITSADFKYTWEQIVNEAEIYDKRGYDQITSLDAADPQTVVVTFKTKYAPWKNLFGGFYGVFPKHLLEGKDRNAEMKDGYEFSGGPWMIESWTKGQEVRLIPNPKWYGPEKANLDAVVFRFFADTAAVQEAFRNGHVSMIYPQSQLELAELKTLPGTEFDVTSGLFYEAIWFNTTKEPLTSKSVRQALAYATDRDAAVKTLFGPVHPEIAPIQSFMTPANKQWYSEPFEMYTRDLKKVEELMVGDGWAQGLDGIWEKGGKKAEIENSTTSGNKRRELAQDILAKQWKEAGFLFKANNTKSATLFAEWGPKGIFTSAIFAQTPPSTDPQLCSVFCITSIPRTEKLSGANWTRINDAKVDAAFTASDAELDDTKRRALIVQGHAALAEAVPGIPLAPFPDILIYNSTKLKGPIGHNYVYGPWYNMHEWYCEGGTC